MPPRGPLARTLAALLLACLVHTARAQQTPAPAPPPFRVGLLVTDEKGLSVDGLRPEDVRVTLGGVEQTVRLLAKDESPVGVGLVVDNSGSLRRLMGAVVVAAQTFVRNLRPDDEAFVVRFVSSDQISLLHDFTSDRAALERALGGMYVEGGRTAVLDALQVSGEHLVKRLAKAGPRRRALVLISDGDDRDSYHKVEDVMLLLREQDVQVFCVALPGEINGDRGLITKSRKEKADELLTRLAAETGGRAFFPKKGDELREALAEVILGLRARYVVEFVPEGKGGRPPSGRLEIRVPGSPGRADRRTFHKAWLFKDGEPELKK